MSDLLQIGRSGVTAYRSALAAVADNVANAETAGYARRAVVLREQGVQGNNPYYIANTTFSGVTAAGVTRAWDDFRAADARAGASDAGRSDARTRWLTTVETALGDGAQGVGRQLTAVYNAADRLAADPGGAASRQSVLLSIDAAAASMRTTAQGLARASDGIAEEARTAVAGVNADITAIARVNQTLRSSVPESSAHAAAADERDRLLDSLSSRVAITIKTGERGDVDVALAGATGISLIKGIDFGTLTLDRAADGRLSLSVFDADGTMAAAPTGGTLAGLVDAATVVADRRASLDALAADFARQLNDWSAAGRDANGMAGPALLMVGAGGAATITPLVGDPDLVAAASTGAANGNALALATARSADGLEGRWTGLVTNHAQLLAAAKSEDTAAATRRDQAFAARDAVAGVDLDVEAAELLRFQQAYGAAARVIQTAREIIQTILDVV